MEGLVEESRINLAGLFREIIQNNPPLTHLDLKSFNGHYDDNKDKNVSEGEIIMESLANS